MGISSYKNTEEEKKSYKDESGNLADDMSPEVSCINETPQKKINQTMSRQIKNSPNHEEERNELHDEYVKKHE